MVVLPRLNVYSVVSPSKVITSSSKMISFSSSPDLLISSTAFLKSASDPTLRDTAMARGAASASMQTAMPSAFQIFLFIAFCLSFDSLFSYMQPTKWIRTS